jgi:hypothetical protein
MNPRKPVLYVLVLAALNGSAIANDDEVQVRIRDERVPAGGVVQMKLERYEVTPISGGRPKFSYSAALFDDVVGIGMFAPTGELAGAAVVDGNDVQISYVTTKTAPGDLPLMTVALRVRNDAPRGSRTMFTLDPSSTWTLNGATIGTRVEPGEVAVGGSLAVSSVEPGQGVLRAGTVVTVRGMGFNKETRLRVEDTDITGVRAVSSSEMQFKLAESTNMTGKRLRLDNRDGSRVYYYSYTRGIPSVTSSRPLLAATVPIFSGRTRSVATFAPLPAMTASQYMAVALMNPTQADASVSVALYLPDGTLWDWSSLSLGAGHRLALELSEMLHSAAPTGARIRITSSHPIHASRLFCDEKAWTVTPALAQ